MIFFRITRLHKKIQRLYILLKEFPRVLLRCCTDVDARVEVKSLYLSGSYFSLSNIQGMKNLYCDLWKY